MDAGSVIGDRIGVKIRGVRIGAPQVLAGAILNVGFNVEVIGFGVGTTGHFLVVANAVSIDVRGAASAANPENILLVSLTVAVPFRLLKTTAVQGGAWAVADSALVQLADTFVLAVANAIAVDVFRAPAATIADGIKRCTLGGIGIIEVARGGVRAQVARVANPVAIRVTQTSAQLFVVVRDVRGVEEFRGEVKPQPDVHLIGVGRWGLGQDLQSEGTGHDAVGGELAEQDPLVFVRFGVGEVGEGEPRPSDHVVDEDIAAWHSATGFKGVDPVSDGGDVAVFVSEEGRSPVDADGHPAVVLGVFEARSVKQGRKDVVGGRAAEGGVKEGRACAELQRNQLVAESSGDLVARFGHPHIEAVGLHALQPSNFGGVVVGHHFHFDAVAGHGVVGETDGAFDNGVQTGAEIARPVVHGGDRIIVAG